MPLLRNAAPSLMLALFLFTTACQAPPGNDVESSSSKADTAQPSPTASAGGLDVPVGTGIAVTANPHATRAGEAVLQAGGSAIDPAVAVEAVLSLVEPQSSGLGGGAFLVYFDSENKGLTVYDGREVAPAGVTEDLFLDDNGEPYGFLAAKNSGLSIGVPGVVDMLALAHDEHGALGWAELFDNAINLAEEGFDVSPRLRGFLERYGDRLVSRRIEDGPLDAYEYFYKEDGTLRDRLTNEAYADALRLLAENPRALYEGPLAEEVVAAAAASPRAGTLSLEDLANFEARKAEALCVPYRGLSVCGPPPPSSWVAVGMALGLLDASDFPTADRNADWKTFIQAQQLAYADRDFYIADDTVEAVPMNGLLDPRYLKDRAGIISSESPSPELTTPGDPWVYEEKVAKTIYGQDTTIDHAGTTHFVIVDNAGNVVSMTASVESIFGSSRMAGGMFLNNQLTDFARQPRDEDGNLVANHPEPGKRPRSSMSPTIALDSDGAFYLATGSPGGNSIIAYTLKTLVAVLDWRLTPEQAVALPNVVARGTNVRIETDRSEPGFIDSMKAFGFEVKESAGENSGVSLVLATSNGLQGAADPRREGTVAIVPPTGAK